MDQWTIKLTDAEMAVSTLRATLRESAAPVYGEEARQQAEVVRSKIRLVESTAAVICRDGPYHQRTAMIIREGESLTKEAQRAVEQLHERANYSGPRKSLMTLQQKSSYIDKHGAEEYGKLPW
jgi:hypothetical protein